MISRLKKVKKKLKKIKLRTGDLSSCMDCAACEVRADTGVSDQRERAAKSAGIDAVESAERE